MCKISLTLKLKRRLKRPHFDLKQATHEGLTEDNSRCSANVAWRYKTTPNTPNPQAKIIFIIIIITLGSLGSSNDEVE